MGEEARPPPNPPNEKSQEFHSQSSSYPFGKLHCSTPNITMSSPYNPEGGGGVGTPQRSKEGGQKSSSVSLGLGMGGRAVASVIIVVTIVVVEVVIIVVVVVLGRLW